MSLKSAASINGGEIYNVVVRVQDSEGAFCTSDDIACGGDNGAIELISVENNTAPTFDDIAKNVEENLLELEKVVVDSVQTVCEEVAVAHLKRPQQIPFFVQSSVFVYNVNTFTVTYNTSTSSFVTLYGTDNIHSANGIGKTVRDHPYPTIKHLPTMLKTCH